MKGGTPLSGSGTRPRPGKQLNRKGIRVTGDRQLRRAFVVTVVWTLGLLFLGSVVHATGSSLACPDWPTCYGSWMPEMTGGVFWEHLHRLVAGGLIVIFGGATFLAWKHAGAGSRILRWCFVGLGLLLIQALLGGVTVILSLPDAVSLSHLVGAFLFLGLATVLAIVSAPTWGTREPLGGHVLAGIRRWSVLVAVLTLVQSGLGAWVRHADAGMACPDMPLCLGQWVPPMESRLVLLHWHHRLVGVVLALATVWLAWKVFRGTRLRRFRRAAAAAVLLVVVQVALGFVAVSTALAVTPVSLHTLVAAGLFAVAVTLATYTWERPGVGGVLGGPRLSENSSASRIGAGRGGL